MNPVLLILLLAFAQNASNSIVSRSRNRDNLTYHIVASVAANTIWFFTLRELVTRDIPLAVFPAYVAGTVSGSVCGVKISMWLERLLDARSDSHLRKDT